MMTLELAPSHDGARTYKRLITPTAAAAAAAATAAAATEWHDPQ